MTCKYCPKVFKIFVGFVGVFMSGHFSHAGCFTYFTSSTSGGTKIVSFTARKAATACISKYHEMEIFKNSSKYLSY